jgi:hypothetical protein
MDPRQVNPPGFDPQYPKTPSTRQKSPKVPHNKSRTLAYSHRSYIRIFEKSATYVLEVSGGLCPALDQVGPNPAQNGYMLQKIEEKSKNSKSLQKTALLSKVCPLLV